MPIDINDLRVARGADPQIVRDSEAKRFPDGENPGFVDQVLALDAEWIKLANALDNKRKEKNKCNKEVGMKKKAKEECDELVAQSKALSVEVVELEEKVKEVRVSIDKMMPKIGNVVHDTVIVSCDEDFNEITNQWGECRTGDDIDNHPQILWKIGGYEPDRGVVVAGHRGYFLRGVAVMLSQALQMYATQFLAARDFTPLQPPYFMEKEVMAGVAQLEQFDEELYHVSDGSKDGGSKYLIATSEQPLCAFHKDDVLQDKELPIRYAGVSTCFRKEAGKHGKDTWGIFRVHQFDKIEQFCITTPDKSWEMHEEMRQSSEDFLQSLGLTYRVVNIVSGELNNAAAKKYDIEGWFPGYGEYKELVSCSNCTDYQSRAMNIRYGYAGENKDKDKDAKSKQYVHLLNSTLCALTRTICCILETYQQEDGVRIPEVLQSYMGGRTFMPYIREEHVNNTVKRMAKSQAKKAVAAGGSAAAAGKQKVKATKAPPPPPSAEAVAAAGVAIEAAGGDAAKAATAQGLKVRELKAEKADKAVVEAAVAILVAIKNTVK